MENMKNDKGYESDGGDSNTSVKTVKSVSEKEDNLNPMQASLPSQSYQRSHMTTPANSLRSSAQVNSYSLLCYIETLIIASYNDPNWGIQSCLIIYFSEFCISHSIYCKTIPKCYD